MDFFISNAYAEGGAAAAQGGGWEALLFPVLMIAVLWFLMIRPQQKRAKEHKTMVEALKKGDEVITGGGIGGTITKVGDAFVTVEVNEGVEFHVQKGAIANLLPKGTLKQL